MKRVPRELRKDLGKYIVLFLFLTLTIGFVSGFLVGDGSMIRAYKESFTKYDIENGHFISDQKLTKKAVRNIEEEDVRLYELFYKDKPFQETKTLRIFRPRKDVDRADIMDGRFPEKAGEIVIDRLFAENNSISIGDVLDVEGTELTVTGTVALSDYSSLFKNNSDMMFDANNFSVAIVTDEQFDDFDNSGLTYCYAWRYTDQGMTDDDQQRTAEDLMEVVYENALLGSDTGWSSMAWNALVSDFVSGDPDADERKSDIDSPLNDYISRQENQAIQFTGEDMGSDKIMFEWFLYIITGVLAFAFAVTTRNTIEQEARTIGTLRASGYTRNELLIHYILPSVSVTLAAAVAGNILGYTAMKYVIVDMYYHSYSLPTYTTIWSAEAFLKTTLIPCALVIAVNCLVVGRALSLSPLQFLRRDLRGKHQSRAVKLPALPFRMRFHLRILIQNRSTFLLLFSGLFLASLIFLFGTLFSPLLQNFKAQVKASQICTYQYVLKDKAKTKDPQAEAYGLYTLVNERGEKISVYGIDPDSRYIDIPQLTAAEDDQVLLTDGFMDKYGLKSGESIVLKEEFSSRRYTFFIADEYKYPASLAVFMTLDQFRDVFGLDDDYYTGYFSDRELSDIDERDVATIITEQDLTVMANQLEDSMGLVFSMFLVFAVVLFLLMIYLLSKLVTERNSYAISMLKILGYTDREAGSLYNSATFIAVAVSMLISGTLGMVLIRVIYYVMMQQFSGWLTFYTAPWGVPDLIATGIACYLLVSLVLMRKIRKIPMTDALKDVF